MDGEAEALGCYLGFKVIAPHPWTRYVIRQLECTQRSDAPALAMLGNPALLDQALIGMLCSRRVPQALE